MSTEKGFRRIVVGVDGTHSSRQALEWAARLAAATSAELVAVHAVEVPGFVAAGVTISGAHASEDVLLAWKGWRAEREHVLDHEWCETLRLERIPYRAMLVEGDASALLRVANREDADGIVVGRRGRGGFDEIVLGSFSHYVVHHSSVPVIVIPLERD